MNTLSKRYSKETIPDRTGPGRPRSSDVDEQILQAALAALGTEGYARMSIDRVAAAAGVSKPTVYLRHAGKAELAVAAIAYLRERQPLPDTGCVRTDLTEELRGFVRGLTRPHGMAMIGTVLAEEQATPELLSAFRERVVTPRRSRIAELLARGVVRGELRPDADLDTAVALLVGASYARYLAGGPFPRDWAARVVALTLDGLLPGEPVRPAP